MKKTQKKLGNKGFSLVELIVVIAIMAVLVGVLAPTLIKNIEKSRESKDAQNIEQIKSACEVALQNENAYQNTVKDTNVTLVTLTSSNCTVASANEDFKTEFDGIMKVEGTKLTSKKYKGKTVTFIVNKDGQVSYSETTTSDTPSANGRIMQVNNLF